MHRIGRHRVGRHRVGRHRVGRHRVGRHRVALALAINLDLAPFPALALALALASPFAFTHAITPTTIASTTQLPLPPQSSNEVNVIRYNDNLEDSEGVVEVIKEEKAKKHKR